MAHSSWLEQGMRLINVKCLRLSLYCYRIDCGCIRDHFIGYSDLAIFYCDRITGCDTCPHVDLQLSAYSICFLLYNYFLSNLDLPFYD